MVSGGPTGRRRETLVAHLERLDLQASLAFVADVWRARGFETAVDSGVVVARRSGQTTVLAPVCSRTIQKMSWWLRPHGDRDIDVVVSFGDNRRGQAVADHHGATHVDSVALVEMLLYALDRHEAERLCERHFGAPIDGLTPPLRTRTRQRIDRFERRVAHASRPTSRGATALVVFVLVLSVGAVSSGLVDSPLDQSTQPGVGSAGGSEAVNSEQPTVEPYEQPTPATARASAADSTTPSAPISSAFVGTVGEDELEPVEDGDLASVPGVSETGITNLTALSDAHEATFSNRSYTLWLDTYRPRDDHPNSTRVQYDTDVAVSGDTYLVVENVEAGRTRARVRTVNYDGSDWYVVEHQNGSQQTRKIDGETADPPIQFEPRQLNPSLVRQYLATRTTNVTGKVRVGNTTYYRIEGSQRPSIGGVEPVRDYQFVAYVDDRGTVSDATVTYGLVSGDGVYRVRFEWTYGNLDSTTIRQPSWTTQNEPRDGE
ncbi:MULTISPECIES: hypothetical protein [Haloferax]|uniref:Uncharacterized protein n=1 Tax=Haloferax marinum TaxID=2666143 RepID=A0A6A8G8E4_9EURY|nr:MULTISPECIES: hypothetical protein [Haloferax]KAB1197810.1 hypothetical protein Hfx1150_09865 [Haloferax sp. CBA1150]MRW96868.1 hypothetical protein [Haloferax marinum]